MSAVATSRAAGDLIDHLVGITPGSPLQVVRALRPDVIQHTQGSYTALLAPTDPADLTLVERAQAALRTAVLTPSPTLIAHYRERLGELGEAEAAIAQIEHFTDDGKLSPRLAAILRHVNLLTTEPKAATQGHLAQLQAQGLSVRAIVALAQLIAFVSYQARVVTTLQLLKEGVA